MKDNEIDELISWADSFCGESKDWGHDGEPSPDTVNQMEDRVEDMAEALRHLRDKVKALREEAEEVRSDYDLLATEMVYSGNSVQHWCQKAKAYKAVIGEMWDVLKKHGIQPDGQTSCVDAMDAALQDGREQ